MRFENTFSINDVLIVVLVGVTIWYACETRKMAKEMRQTNMVNLRPYVLIQGISANMAAREAMSQEQSQELRSIFNAEERTFIFASDPEEMNYLYYSLKNTGIIPAHVVRQVISAEEVYEDGTRHAVSVIDSEFITSNVIFPAQEKIRLAKIGKGAKFRKTAKQVLLETTIKIYYQNSREGAGGLYYTSITLQSPITASTDGRQTIAIINEDEGIEEQK